MHDPQTLIGQTLTGRYLVKRLIGRGGMGAVFEGENLEIGKRVAIKTIDQHHSQSHELAQRLRREARAASSVESTHIVQVFDVGEDPKCGVYMVMEYLSGEDLSKRLQREGKIEIGVAVSIAHQLARALAKAHMVGVVHRDLKPANVFLLEGEDGGVFVKVVDFGISKLLRESVASEGRNLTRMGSAIGTPQYMSPEQAQGLPDIDHRTDVWALGSVLYEMIAGRAPYEEMPSYEMTIVRILTGKPPPLSAVAPSTPRSITDLVDHALEHDLPRRMADCTTFAKRLIEAMPRDAAIGTGRYSAMSSPSPISVPIVVQPHYAGAPPGTMLGLAPGPNTPVPKSSLDQFNATMPLHEEQPRKPISTNTAVSLATPITSPHTGTLGAATMNGVPGLVPWWKSTAIKVAAAVVLLGAGGLTFALMQGGDTNDAQSSVKSVEPASKSNAKAKSKEQPSPSTEPAPPASTTPPPAPSASIATPKTLPPKVAGTPPGPKASTGPATTATGKPGYGGTGLSESY